MTASKSSRSRSSLLMVVAAAVIVAAIVLIWTSVSEDVDAPSTAATTPAGDSNESGTSLSQLAERDPNDVMSIGEVDAPVVLIEWSDYRCPFCGVFARDVQPELVQQYVDEGLLRIEFRDLPVFGEQSVDAAVAARAAGLQDRYWQFHEVVYAAAPERGHADLDRAALLDFAEQAGVSDMTAFEAALDDPALLTQVQADLAEGQGLGITGTPTFIIGETPVIGAQPLEAFQQVIDAEIDAAT